MIKATLLFSLIAGLAASCAGETKDLRSSDQGGQEEADRDPGVVEEMSRDFALGQRVCSSTGLDTYYEYIQQIKLSDFDSKSGDNKGYLQHSRTVTLKPGSHAMQLVPGFRGYKYQENWSVWIDFNQNGAYENSEMVLVKNSKDPITQNIVVPENALSGKTTMRVSMRYGGAAPTCGSFTYGEVEDINVEIAGRPADPSAPVATTEISSPDFVGNELIPEPGPEVFKSFDFSKEGLSVENVAVQVDIAHPYVAALTVTLYHPNGTAIVLHNRGKNAANTLNNLLQAYGKDGGNLDLSSIKGKSVKGIWKIGVKDWDGYNDRGMIKKLSLKLYAAAASKSVTGRLVLDPKSNLLAISGVVDYSIDEKGLITYKGQVSYFGNLKVLSRMLPAFLHKFEGTYQAKPTTIQSKSYHLSGPEFLFEPNARIANGSRYGYSHAWVQFLKESINVRVDLDLQGEIVLFKKATLYGRIFGIYNTSFVAVAASVPDSK
jgi:subtilisin-like proprotein convertase family protein